MRLDAAALEAPVRSLLGDPSARVTAWSAEPIAYDFLNPSSEGVDRVAGTAQTRSGEVPWSLVLKRTRRPEPAGLPAEIERALATAVRWDRELLAYESGFLDELAEGFAAAACHGGVSQEDGSWLWLEDLGDLGAEAWPLARWEHVARALGRFNARYAGAVPPHDWLGRGWLRNWVTRLTPHHFGDTLPGGPAWEREDVRAAFPAGLRERLAALWSVRDERIARVEALPQTVSHLDSHRRNLVLRGDEVVAIDWGLVGRAAPGEEIASTLVGSVASGEVPVEDAEELAELLVRGYLAGLREAGWTGDEADVRLAFGTAASLRAFSVLVVDAGADARERFSRLARALVALDPG